MSELKRLAKEAVPRALEKAERYRLLNEPAEAESISIDVLAVDPENQQALVLLLLSLTDQLEHGVSDARARDVLPRLKGEYERAYYAGLIWERKGKAIMRQGSPGSGSRAYHALAEAMECYEKAEALRPPANDDAILRWNTCVRLLERHPHLVPATEDRSEPPLE
jgi:tetratricopeptide (TPR) repeat protein